MRKPNLSSVANGLGRIAIASVLVGVFATTVTLLEDPSMVDMGGFDILEGYVSVFMQLSITTALYSFGVIAVMLTLWVLSTRISQRRSWAVVTAFGVLLAVVFATSESHGLWGTATGVLIALAKLSAILLGVAIVEVLFEYDLSDDLSLTDASTAYGSVLLVFIITIALIATGTGIVSTVGSATGDDSKYAYTGTPEDEFRAQFQPVLESQRGSDLVCSGGNLSEREPALSVAETHENDLSNWQVNGSVYEEDDYEDNRWSSLALYLEPTNEERLYKKRVIRTGEGASMDYPSMSTRDVNGGRAFFQLTDSKQVANETEMIDETIIELYTVTDDGEVHRYAANLCDDNLE